VVEQEGYGVREDLAQQPTHQVPQIPRPHPLYGVASHELRKNGVHPVAEAAQEDAPFGGSRFLEECGASSSTLMLANSSSVLGEW
jgi:hypothetical protein